MVRRDLRSLHDNHPNWGSHGDKWARGVVSLVKRYEAESVLDYGAGKGNLGLAVSSRMPSLRWNDYEPAYRAGSPVPADIVICTHVLEHVEGVEETIPELRRLARIALFVSVGCGPGRDWAPNRNVQSPTWWAGRLSRHFSAVHPVARLQFQQGQIRRGKQKNYLTAVCRA